MRTAVAVMVSLVLAQAAFAGAYVNTAFGYRIELPAGFAARGDEVAKQIALESDGARGRAVAVLKPVAVSAVIGDKVRQKDEAALAQRAKKYKRVAFEAPLPAGLSGASWAYAFASAEAGAQIVVTSLVGYPQGGQHAWVKLQLVAPLSAAKEAGRRMRALIKGFSVAQPAPPPTAAVTMVGKPGAADAMVLDDTGSLAKVAFDTKTVKEELEVYHRDVFGPAVAMEKRLAALFEDVHTRAERKELTEQGTATSLREIAERYRAFVSQLEANAPPSQEMAQAHQGVVAFYRERAGLYDQIVDGQTKKDQAAITKAAQALDKQDFRQTPACQMLEKLTAQYRPTI